MAKMRLDKFLADMGIASRKELKQIIKSGRVSVNSVAVTVPEAKVDSDCDIVSLDGELLQYSRFRYFMMDKPCGVLTATEDSRQQTVMDLLSPEHKRMELFPVGRLDKDTSGLLLLTNDGEFSHRVISPKSCVEKRYYARVDGEATAEDVSAFEKGLVLGDGTQCLPAKLELLGGDECIVTVMEGKYHQVRRMLASRGMPVLVLRRLSIGELCIEDNLGTGGYRELDKSDLCKVLQGYFMEN